MPLDWELVREKIYPGMILKTEKDKRPIVYRITDTYIKFDLGSSYQRVQRSTLEMAVDKMEQGVVIETVSDLKNIIRDDRPSYAWAVLRYLGYIEIH